MRELGGILAHKVIDPDKVEPDEELSLEKFDQPASDSKLPV
jgi:hypothetical protein